MNFPVVFKEKRLKIRRFAEKKCGKKMKTSVENQFSLNFAASRRMVEKKVGGNSPLRGELVFFHQKMV